MRNWHTEKEIPVEFPVLDLKLLASDNRELSKLTQIVSDSGLFYLKNFGIDQADLDRFVNVTQSFFNEDEKLKKRMVCNELPLRGYTPIKTENLAKLLKIGDYPDLCMKYSWANEDSPAPSDNFRIIWQQIFDEMNGISKALLSLISMLLKDDSHITPDDWNKVINGDNMLRHLYYPDLKEAQELSMAPHSDLGSVTLLYQTPADNNHIALEAMYKGNYLPVPAVKGTLIVNFGDILEHITKKKVKATKHRVVHSPRAGSSRTSTAFFCLPQRSFNLKKYRGSDFSGLISEKMNTFGDLIDWDAEIYSNKKGSK